MNSSMAKTRQWQRKDTFSGWELIENHAKMQNTLMEEKDNRFRHTVLGRKSRIAYAWNESCAQSAKAGESVSLARTNSPDRFLLKVASCWTAKVVDGDKCSPNIWFNPVLPDRYPISRLHIMHNNVILKTEMALLICDLVFPWIYHAALFQ